MELIDKAVRGDKIENAVGTEYLVLHVGSIQDIKSYVRKHNIKFDNVYVYGHDIDESNVILCRCEWKPVNVTEKKYVIYPNDFSEGNWYGLDILHAQKIIYYTETEDQNIFE